MAPISRIRGNEDARSALRARSCPGIVCARRNRHAGPPCHTTCMAARTPADGRVQNRDDPMSRRSKSWFPALDVHASVNPTGTAVSFRLKRGWPAIPAGFCCPRGRVGVRAQRIFPANQLRSGLELHRWDQTDMHYYDAWGRKIASGDWLSTSVGVPMHGWHHRVAESYFAGHPDVRAALIERATAQGGDTGAEALWSRSTGGPQFYQDPPLPLSHRPDVSRRRRRRAVCFRVADGTRSDERRPDLAVGAPLLRRPGRRVRRYSRRVVWSARVLRAVPAAGIDDCVRRPRRHLACRPGADPGLVGLVRTPRGVAGSRLPAQEQSRAARWRIGGRDCVALPPGGGASCGCPRQPPWPGSPWP